MSNYDLQHLDSIFYESDMTTQTHTHIEEGLWCVNGPQTAITTPAASYCRGYCPFVKIVKRGNKVLKTREWQN